MNWMNLLIILGCLAGGYWLVSSIMGPGANPPPDKSAAKPGAQDVVPMRSAPAGNWYLILDVPADSSRSNIEAAYKRRLSKAESDGDSIESQRVREAYATGIQQLRR